MGLAMAQTPGARAAAARALADQLFLDPVASARCH